MAASQSEAVLRTHGAHSSGVLAGHPVTVPRAKNTSFISLPVCAWLTDVTLQPCTGGWRGGWAVDAAGHQGPRWWTQSPGGHSQASQCLSKCVVPRLSPESNSDKDNSAVPNSSEVDLDIWLRMSDNEITLEVFFFSPRIRNGNQDPHTELFP